MATETRHRAAHHVTAREIAHVAVNHHDDVAKLCKLGLRAFVGITLEEFDNAPASQQDVTVYDGILLPSS